MTLGRIAELRRLQNEVFDPPAGQWYPSMVLTAEMLEFLDAAKFLGAQVLTAAGATKQKETKDEQEKH